MGRGLFKGAICCINNPEIVGLTASANSIGDIFLIFWLARTSNILFRSLIGIFSANNDLRIDVSIFKGINFGTADDTNCGEVLDKLSKSA